MATTGDHVDKTLNGEFLRFIDKSSNYKYARNAWVHGDFLKVYVRIGMRYIGSPEEPASEKELLPTVDLATFEILDPSDERKGYSRSFITRVIEEAKKCNLVVFIENVTIPAWSKKLQENHGFVYHDYPDCLVLRP